MNINTFRDAVQSRKSALANDIQDDDDDEREVAPMRRPVEGEEDESKEKFTEDGIQIEPFNLKNEREGGYFDENQNYVFKKEVGEVDAWIAGLDEQTIEAAIGEAALAEKKRIAKREMEETRIEQSRKTTPELKAELLTYLHPGETIVACLRRLSGRSSTGNGDLKGARRRPGNDGTANMNKDKQIHQATVKENKLHIDRLTEIADQLIAQGLSGIYSMSYEAIYSSTVLWEYKAVDGNIYGPYTSQQISEWKSQGFLTGSTSVLIRKAQPAKIVNTGSIYDDEDDEQDDIPEWKKAKMEQSDSCGVLVEDDDNWKNSDEIDFGEFIDLNELVSHQRGKSTRHGFNVSDENGKREDDNDDEDDDMVIEPKRRKRATVEHDEDD